LALGVAVPSLKPPTALESVSGNVVTEGVLTIVGALSGGPVGALLPVLSSTLAASRQRQRIEQALAEIDATLSEHRNLLEGLSDAQYKLLNETILALLHTTDPAKITYLRNAVRNSLSSPDVAPHDAVALSRIVRDISAEEALFLTHNFRYSRVQLWPLEPGDDSETILAVSPESKQVTVVSGLASLGLLVVTGPAMADTDRYAFSPLVAKLLALFREARP
jgi:hypothetical protein